MKKNILLILIAISIGFATSCKEDEDEDEGKLPNISFKTGAGYKSANDSITKGDSVLVGINASKSEDKDVLKTFDASRSYDGGANTSFVNEQLSGGQGDSYSKDIWIKTRNQAGIEKYTFTVINRDGLTNSVSLTLTVH